eukprot:6636844-Alexandrium_andersonii.AAC.1
MGKRRVKTFPGAIAEKTVKIDRHFHVLLNCQPHPAAEKKVNVDRRLHFQQGGAKHVNHDILGVPRFQQPPPG